MQENEKTEHFAKEQERRQDIKVIKILIPIICIILLCVWIFFIERAGEISKKYNGAIYNADMEYIEEATLEIVGDVIYKNKISDMIVDYKVKVILKNSKGEIIFETNKDGSIGVDSDSNWTHIGLTAYDENDLGFIGYIDSFDKLETVELRYEKEDIYFISLKKE